MAGKAVHNCIRCEQEFDIGSKEVCPRAPDRGEHETPHAHFFTRGRLGVPIQVADSPYGAPQRVEARKQVTGGPFPWGDFLWWSFCLVMMLVGFFMLMGVI